jgi:hypothetical protein
LASGTGSLNVLAAAGLLTANSSGFPATTSISGQPISRSGIAFSDTSGIDKEFAFVVTRRHKQSARTQEIVWYTSANDTIIWSTGETIILTNSEGSSDTIIWSTVARNETIIWTATDTIVWTNANSDTIIWSSHSPYDDSSDVAKGVWSGSRHDQDTIIWSIALEQ